MKHIKPRILFILWLLCASCSTSSDKQQIEAALQQYDHLIQKVDADSIALLYAPDGDLGSMAHGRDSIRKFLASFKNIEVLSNNSRSDFIALAGDSALQRGTYRQVAVVAKKDTLRLTGHFTANWMRLPEGWRIKKMLTFPDTEKK